MLYNAIIAEDELNIREGIRDFVQGSAGLGIQVAECFNDGDKAIEYIKNNEVDIVIADVKMLKVSGIEVAKYVYEHCPDTRVIILSGFQEFEYARDAAKYNVQHYLLKPTDFKELRLALEETVTKLREEKKRKRLAEDYENVIPALRKEFLTDIALGAIKNKEEFLKRYKLLGIDNSPDECVCCVVNLEITNYYDYLSGHWVYGKDQLNRTIRNFIESQNNKEFRLFHILNNNERMTLLCIAEKEEAVYLNISSLENASNDLKLNLCFSLADKIYKGVWGYVKEGVLLKNIGDASSQTERIKLLMSHMSLGNIAEADAIITDFITTMAAMPVENSTHLALGIVTEVFNRLEQDYDTEIILNGFDIDAHRSNIHNARSLSDIQKNVEEIFSETIRRLKMHNGLTLNTIIARANKFMQENFSRDISLEDVANHVFLNPAYFSRFYKKHTNENYITYLLSLRIEHAKKMIREGYSVEQTAAGCGYGSRRYFLNIFKKSTGMTPSSYRRTLMETDQI